MSDVRTEAVFRSKIDHIRFSETTSLLILGRQPSLQFIEEQGFLFDKGVVT